MAYSKTTDNFLKTINTGIQTLWNSEFPRDLLIYQPEFRKQDVSKRGQYTRFYMDSSDVQEQGAQYENRTYSYQFSYYYLYSGDDPKRTFENVIADKWSHIYYYFSGFRGYEPTSGYAWHHLEFTSVSPLIWGIEDIDNTENVGHIDATVDIWRTNELELSEAVISGEVTLE